MGGILYVNIMNFAKHFMHFEMDLFGFCFQFFVFFFASFALPVLSLSKDLR